MLLGNAGFFTLLLSSLMLMVSFCKHPCFCWRFYCFGSPVLAFISTVAGVPAVVGSHAFVVIFWLT
jgi:hypothetical protein